ncbi:MAG: AAA family ATPase [Bacteroidota bacterium]
MARQLVGRVNFEEHVRLVQFHPSYTYEDFVRGISAKSEGGEIIYETENKLLASFAEKARLNWEAAQKDEVDLSREERVKTLMREFADWVQDELDEKSSFKITEAVSIVQVETDAFRYTGEWNTSQRMKFKDLIQAELLGVSNRQELIKAEGLSGLAKQHASYFIKVLEQFRRRYADILRQSVDVNVESPEVLPFVIIIDEINRANLPSVLGELIYALEYRNEPVESLYALDGDNTIVIPENLYIIGTMNTADRRVGHIDYAIKRRFAFLEVLPREAVIYHEQAKELFRRVSKLFVTEEHGKLVSSEFLAPDFSYRDVQLGHSYFMLQEGPANEQTEELKLRWNYEILPLLREYVKDGLLLETALEEIENIASFVD